MKQVHVIPVGTSLLDHLRDDRNGVPADLRDALLDQDGTPLRTRLRDARDPHADVNVAALLDHDPTTAAAVATKMKSTVDGSWCGELNSLHTLRLGRVSAYDAESVLLIATDTENGLHAGALLGLLLSDDGRIRYLDDPVNTTAAVSLSSAGGQTVLARVPGLNLDSTIQPRPNSATWSALGELGRIVAHLLTQGGWGAEFHLTGGYRALLPFLLTAAEAVATVLHERGGHGPIAAHALHDDSERHVTIPVHRFTGQTLTRLRQLTTYVGDRDRIDGNDFDDLRGSYLTDSIALGPRSLTETALIIVRVLRELGDRSRDE